MTYHEISTSKDGSRYLGYSFLYESFRLKRVRNGSFTFMYDVVPCNKAFGLSGSGQITWDFQTGPWESQRLCALVRFPVKPLNTKC